MTLSTSDLMTLRAVQEGTLRRRKSAPPIMEVPSLVALIEQGLLCLSPNGRGLNITEAGSRALQSGLEELRKRKGDAE